MSRARDFADLAGSADAGGLTGRNLIINGAMQVAQRGTSASVSNSSNEGYQTLDRFRFDYANNAGGVATISQDTTVPSGYGFSNSYKVDVTTADTSLDSTHMIYFRQSFEGQSIRNSGWDYTSTSSFITLSFWAKSSKAGTYNVVFRATDVGALYYPVEYTLVADTWKKVTFTIPGDSALVINNDTGNGFEIRWVLALGTDRNDGTANQWNSVSSNNAGTSNQVNFFDSTSNDFYLTGVQLEVGEKATPFEHRSFADELLRCQRYAVVYSAASSGNETFIGSGTTIDSDDVLVVASLPNNLRATPTATFTNFGVRTAASYTYNNTINGIFPPEGGNTIGFNIDSADTPYTAGQAVLCVISAGSSNHLTLDAEL